MKDNGYNTIIEMVDKALDIMNNEKLSDEEKKLSVIVILSTIVGFCGGAKLSGKNGDDNG